MVDTECWLCILAELDDPVRERYNVAIACEMIRTEKESGITAHARTTLQAFHDGRASYGTVDDLRRDLLADE